MRGEEGFMGLALRLAERGAGRVSPNPMVGAVLVKGGRIISTGYHARFGGPHAEANALRKAGKMARGATLYVTLEPCSHYGKTPPCTKAIARAGVKRVVAAMRDPNPLVRGVEELRRLGIKVELGLMEREARKLNEAYVKHMKTKMPFVILKCAMSLDGKIATRTGDSKWISGSKARAEVHKMRGKYDAVLVGIVTVLKDDPRLTCRARGGRNSARVVLDSRLMIPLRARVLQNAKREKVIIATARGCDRKKKTELERMGAEVWVVGEEKADMRTLMRQLGRVGIASVMIEGGGEANAAAIEAGIVDKVVFFISPKIIGGKGAPSPVGGQGVARLWEAIGLGRVSVRRVGKDFLFEGYVI